MVFVVTAASDVFVDAAVVVIFVAEDECVVADVGSRGDPFAVVFVVDDSDNVVV